MLLAIDAGNTNTVFAVYDGESRLGTWRCGTNARRTADEYAVWLIDLMALDDLKREDIEAAVLGSVVPEANFNLLSLCDRYFGAFRRARYLQSRVRDIDRPARTGGC